MSGHGGKRAGAGRKTAAEEAANANNITKFNEARARKEIALADRRELEVRKLKGEVLDAEEVAAALERILGIARDHLLAIPGRIADALEDEAVDRRLVEEVARQHINQTLDNLANQLRSKFPQLEIKPLEEPNR